jgi:hypothetical protein
LSTPLFILSLLSILSILSALSWKKRPLFLFFCTFTCYFLTENAFKRAKWSKIGVFRSQLGTPIAIQTRPFLLYFSSLFVRLNAFLKNFVCLGGRLLFS